MANTISYKPICLFLFSSPIEGIDKMQKRDVNRTINSWALNYPISDRDGAIKAIKKDRVFNDAYRFFGASDYFMRKPLFQNRHIHHIQKHNSLFLIVKQMTIEETRIKYSLRVLTLFQLHNIIFNISVYI